MKALCDPQTSTAIIGFIQHGGQDWGSYMIPAGYFPALGASIAVGYNSYQSLSINQGWGRQFCFDPNGGFLDDIGPGSSTCRRSISYREYCKLPGSPLHSQASVEPCEVLNLAIHAKFPDFPELTCGCEREGWRGVLLSLWNSHFF